MKGSYYNRRLPLERERKRKKNLITLDHHTELLCNIAKNIDLILDLENPIVMTEVDLWSNDSLVGRVDAMITSSLEDVLIECKTSYTPERRLEAKQQLKDYLKHLEVKEYTLYTAYYQLMSDYGIYGLHFRDEEYGDLFLVPEGKWVNYQGKVYPVVEK